MASVYGVAECCDTFSEPKAASALLVACSVPPMVITSPLLLRFEPPPPRGELPLLEVCFAETVFFPVPISWKMQPPSEGAAEAATVTAATPSPAIDLLSAAAAAPVVVTICSMSYSVVVVVVAADGEVMKTDKRRADDCKSQHRETESVRVSQS